MKVYQGGALPERADLLEKRRVVERVKVLFDALEQCRRVFVRAVGPSG